VGPACQRNKKKEKETAARAVAGEGKSGLLGLLGRKVSAVGFLFFSNPFQNILLNSNSNQISFKFL
jgi:hypothetical protein